MFICCMCRAGQPGVVVSASVGVDLKSCEERDTTHSCVGLACYEWTSYEHDREGDMTNPE